MDEDYTEEEIDAIIAEMESLPIEKIAENLLAGMYEKDLVSLARRLIVKANYRFSKEQISQLRYHDYIQSHVYELLAFGYVFSFDELINFVNPDTDTTEFVYFYDLIRKMATNGYKFTETEIMQLCEKDRRVSRGSVKSTLRCYEPYKHKSKNQQRKNIHKKSYFLTYKNGRPYFAIKTMDGFDRYLEHARFGELDPWNVIDNIFELYIIKNSTGWYVKIGKCNKFDPSEYILQKKSLFDLVDTLNKAIQDGDEFDFTESLYANVKKYYLSIQLL
jgi:hypothetical protein